MSSSLTAIDLFAGAGGLSTGFKWAGVKVLVATDYWADAAVTYRHNHTDTVFLTDDIRTLTGGRLLQAAGVPKVDLVIGGPPCQGFSTLGKRDVADPRNELFQEFIRLVDEIKPRAVLIENVGGLLVMENGNVAQRIVAALEHIGYRVAMRELMSADYGVPQLRRRVFFVGTRNGLPLYQFPEPSHGPGRLPYVTVAEAISDLPALAASEMSTQYDRRPSTVYAKERRNRCPFLTCHEAAHHSKALVEAISHVPDGGNRKSIPDHLQPRSGFHNSYSRLASFKPAVAITSNLRKPSSARAIHPFQNRGLTVREGARLQSFNDDYVFCGARTSQYVQVGNAVPPLLAATVAGLLCRLLRGGEQPAVTVQPRRKEAARVKRT